MTRLLVVSVAAINEPHRRAYDTVSRELGWEVHIAAPREIQFQVGKAPQSCAPRPSAAGYQLHPLRHRFYDQQRLHYYEGLELLVARLRPDVVFAEYDPGSVAILQSALPPAGQRVLAFSVENILRDRWAGVVDSVRNRRPRELARDGTAALLLAAGAASCSGLACISEQSRAVFLEQGWSKPIEVVPLGTDTRAFHPGKNEAARKALRIDGKFVVGYFGRLVEEKGVDVLVDALGLLPDNVVLLLDAYVNFAPGSYAQRVMHRVKELGLFDRVRTIDVPHAEVPEYMRCCDCLVLPSRTTERWKEQFGRVLPEAMACEVPVIGTESGNIPDMIGDAGLLVPEGDANAIAMAIRQLLEQPSLCETLGRRGRQRVVERFSLEAQARALGRLVASVCAAS